MTELDKRIKALCEAKAIKLRPWEFPPPWEVEDGEKCPYPRNTAGGQWWPKLMALRASLKAELEQ
jgi:hypothetical protein